MPTEPAQPVNDRSEAIPGDLFGRAVKGGFWVFALRLAQKLLGLVSLVVLAKVLVPEDFGLMGVALLTLATINTFTQTGFGAALIQKTEGVAEYLDSAWTIGLIRGVVLFGVIFFLAAPVAAVFFENGQVEGLVRAISFSVLLGALGNIGTVYFSKDLHFYRQFFLQLSGTLVNLAVTITIAVIYRSVWALVLGKLAGELCKCVSSYLLHPYRPKLCWDIPKARMLWGFGKWVLGTNILAFLIMQGDDIFVGKYLSAAWLGLYRYAYRFANMPATEISLMVSQVAFPAYSKLSGDLERLKLAYLKVLRVTALLIFPVSGLIFVLSPEFVEIFLPPCWLPIIPVMRVLVWWGLIVSVTSAMSPVFMALGHPKAITQMLFFQTAILCVLIYPLTKFLGLEGTALAVLSSALLMFLVRSHLLIRMIRCRYRDFFEILAYPLAVTGLSIRMGLWGKSLFAEAPPVLVFISSGLVFFVTFVIATYVVDSLTGGHLVSILAEMRRMFCNQRHRARCEE